MSPFADIRIIKDRQVLAQKDTDEGDDSPALVFTYYHTDGTRASMKMGFKKGDTRDAAFLKFTSGALDVMLFNQIEQSERDFPTEPM